MPATPFKAGAGASLLGNTVEVSEITGLTASVEELNLIDGSVAGTAVASKALVLGADKNVDTIAVAASGLKIGSGAGTAMTATAAELNVNAGVVAGTATASKTAVLGANKNLDTLDVVTLKNDGITMSSVKWVDVAVTAALLDAAGTAPVIAAATGDSYKIRNIRLVGGGTNFDGAGDRLISLTDGTTTWTTIANADIEAAPAATLDWGNTKVPFLTGTSNTASVAGEAIRFIYTGGTTDHSGVGSITFSVAIEKVA